MTRSSNGWTDLQVDHCPGCGGRMLQLYAMRGLGIKAGRVPTVSDDESWEALRADHGDGCYWWSTRAYRVAEKGAA